MGQFPKKIAKLILFFCFLLKTNIGLAATQQAPTPPTQDQVRDALAERWQSFNLDRIQSDDKEISLWQHISRSEIGIKQCNKVRQSIFPSYICQFNKLPKYLGDYLASKDGERKVSSYLVALRWEDNRWQVKPVFFPEPTNEEIIRALNNVWLYEKDITYQNLIYNRQQNKHYIPTPGYGLGSRDNLPSKKSDRAHEKRKKNISALPDTPFLDHPIRTHCQLIDTMENNSFAVTSTYNCTLNKKDLEHIFPFLAKSNKYAIESYEKALKSGEKIHYANPKKERHTASFTRKIIQLDNDWVTKPNLIVGYSHLDPFLSNLAGLHYYDGCMPPSYRPEE